MDVLTLRFDAPLMSFGAPMVDELGFIQDFPARSMIAGLLANALGWRHGQVESLQALQESLRVASRRDRAGVLLRDYQTVDLGQPFLDAARVGWTTRGRLEKRGGAFSNATHQRWRDYHADSVHTLALAVGEAAPVGLERLATALEHPARPLFLGRKPCLPAAPLLLGSGSANSLLEALRRAPSLPAHRRDERHPEYPAWWPADEQEGDTEGQLLRVSEDRDWLNQIHAGHSLVRHGTIRLEAQSDDD